VGEVESAGRTESGRLPSAFGREAVVEACCLIFCSRSCNFALAAVEGGRGELVEEVATMREERTSKTVDCQLLDLLRSEREVS